MKIPNKKIEILCTLGPASMDTDTITRLEDQGISLFRINLSHTRYEDLASVIEKIQAVTDVPICLDTEGAQIRTTELEKGSLTVREGDEVVFAREKAPARGNEFNLHPLDIVDQLKAGDHLSIDFNAVLVEVVRVDQRGAAARVLNGGTIGQNKAVTLDRDVALPVLTEKDEKALRLGAKYGIKHVALSFANRASDVDLIRKIAPAGSHVISKIECRNGLLNLREIAAKTDALLIDRGDLSREEPIERIPWLQKYIIRNASEARKKVYVATNLLESMTVSPGPTRAEVNDVMNTLIDGADGLVLAAETAIGANPVGCANMLRRLILQFEAGFDTSLPYQPSAGTLRRKPALVCWFTGLSGAGKSTIAAQTKVLLEKEKILVQILDGDVVRRRMNKDLGFSPQEIRENNRRIAEMCEKRRRDCDVILVPIISPYAGSRAQAREQLGEGFYEIHIDADLECVAARDPKGLYEKARRNEIRNMIGYSPNSPYEAPQKPDLVIRTAEQPPEQSANALFQFIRGRIGAWS